MILLYDGSLNSDWIFQYAVSFAISAGEKLSIVHVLDGKTDADSLNLKINNLEQSCRERSIESETAILPVRSDVYSTIIGHIQGTSDNIICGTRIRHKNKGYIKGTISEKMIQSGKFNLLALRVVHPGLLGRPSSIYCPFHDGCLNGLLPFAKYFEKCDAIHLSFLREFNSLYTNHISFKKETAIRRELMEMLSACVETTGLHGTWPEDSLHLHTSMTDSRKKEILILASRLKSDFILLPWETGSSLSRIIRGNTVEYILKNTPINTGVYFAK